MIGPFLSGRSRLGFGVYGCIDLTGSFGCPSQKGGPGLDRPGLAKGRRRETLLARSGMTGIGGLGDRWNAG